MDDSTEVAKNRGSVSDRLVWSVAVSGSNAVAGAWGQQLHQQGRLRVRPLLRRRMVLARASHHAPAARPLRLVGCHLRAYPGGRQQCRPEPHQGGLCVRLRRENSRLIPTWPPARSGTRLPVATLVHYGVRASAPVLNTAGQFDVFGHMTSSECMSILKKTKCEGRR